MGTNLMTKCYLKSCWKLSVTPLSRFFSFNFVEIFVRARAVSNKIVDLGLLDLSGWQIGYIVSHAPIEIWLYYFMRMKICSIQKKSLQDVISSKPCSRIFCQLNFEHLLFDLRREDVLLHNFKETEFFVILQCSHPQMQNLVYAHLMHTRSGLYKNLSWDFFIVRKKRVPRCCFSNLTSSS